MVVRLSLVRAWRRDPQRFPPLTWARMTMCQCGAVGLAWGIGAIWLMGYGTPYEDVIFGCIALASVMVAMSNVSYWPAHLAFHVPMFFFLGIAYGRDPEPQAMYLAVSAWVVCPSSPRWAGACRSASTGPEAGLGAPGAGAQVRPGQPGTGDPQPHR